jgi:catechol 2,3-dioxygenase-like lactoylglutathione lyase family enzyme
MRLDTVTLTSRDLARSRAFYAGKLGFRVLEEDEGRAFVLDAGGVRLTVDREGTRAPLSAAEPRLVFRTNQVAARCTQLRDLGISVDGPIAVPGGVQATLTDPDGHPIVLVER